METITRNEASALLKKYNKESFHIQHALTVEAVMKWYAKELGYVEGADQLGWELTRLLTMTLEAMAASEDTINVEMEAEG